jgi:glycosyltransferase involved in cell wall biosynthesis
VGWNLSRAMATHHDVYVLTRSNNREAIELELAKHPVDGLRFLYYDLPRWARWWKRGGRGVRAYYQLWQLGAIREARLAHAHYGFDLSHHITFVKYWAPAAAAFVGVPFVWGPVGGGESMPAAFLRGLSPRSRAYEVARLTARWLGERDPTVRATARRAQIAIATTPETASRLRLLVRCPVMEMPELALTNEDIESLGAFHRDEAVRDLTFLSVGQLIGLKGYHLSLRAFARASIPGSRYMLIGDGPERKDLEQLAVRLGVSPRVDFLGSVPRSEVLRRLADADVFVHPSLHDSGGWATVEAMAAGLPAIVLGIGGPATQVTSAAGIVISVHDPAQVVEDMAVAMSSLATSAEGRRAMGMAARSRVSSCFAWGTRAARLAECWRLALEHAASDTADEL